MESKEIEEIIDWGKHSEVKRVRTLEEKIRRLQENLKEEETQIEQNQPKKLDYVTIMPVRKMLDGSCGFQLIEYGHLLKELNSGTPIVVLAKDWTFPLDYMVREMHYLIGKDMDDPIKFFKEVLRESKTEMMVTSDAYYYGEKSWISRYCSNIFVPNQNLSMNLETYKERLRACSTPEQVYDIIRPDIGQVDSPRKPNFGEEDLKKFDEIFKRYMKIK